MSAFAPLRRAVIAGAVGTLAMDALWYQRYRHAGGSDSFIGWEFGGPAATFSEAGAPAQLGQALASRFDIQLPESSARLTNNVVRWATGIGWGIVHSVVGTVDPNEQHASGVAVQAAASALHTRCSGIVWGSTSRCPSSTVRRSGKTSAPTWSSGGSTAPRQVCSAGFTRLTRHCPIP